MVTEDRVINLTSNKPRIKLSHFDRNKYVALRDKLKTSPLNTVCVEANCPNRHECFASGTATFMILGDTCTRACRYCNVKSGIPKSIPNEAEHVARFVKKLNLNYIVITSVTRDDLPDGGASVFADCCRKIREDNPNIKIELLIPDLKGDWDALKVILDAKPDVLNHNIEIVKPLYKKLRPIGGYDLALELLSKVKEIDPSIKTKSGLMVGFGEDLNDIKETLTDLRQHNCDFLTVGQYLQPSKKHAKVVKFYTPVEFKEIQSLADEIGFEEARCGALVRSSYKAHEMLNSSH